MSIADDSCRVDAYLQKHSKWQPALTQIRTVINRTELVETIKWGGPAYTLEGRILLGLGAYKAHCAIWFHEGVFLQDNAGVLQTAQASTRGMRQWRITAEDKLNKKLLAAYVKETIANEHAGKRLAPQARKTTAPGRLPAELRTALAADNNLQSAFNALTPGRQREYADHVASAKRDATRASRLQKMIPLIKAGRGLNDKYRS